MKQPSIDLLMSKFESKYALVAAAAKRARMLTDGAKPFINAEKQKMSKPVSIALEEIAQDMFGIEHPKHGIK